MNQITIILVQSRILKVFFFYYMDIFKLIQYLEFYILVFVVDDTYFNGNTIIEIKYLIIFYIRELIIILF